MKALIATAGIYIIRLDYCQFGEKWLQPTILLTNCAALQALASLTGADIQALAGEHLTKATDACCLPQPDAVDFYQEHYHTYQRAAAHVEALYREGRPL